MIDQLVLEDLPTDLKKVCLGALHLAFARTTRDEALSRRAWRELAIAVRELPESPPKRSA